MYNHFFSLKSSKNISKFPGQGLGFGMIFNEKEIISSWVGPNDSDLYNEWIKQHHKSSFSEYKNKSSHPIVLKVKEALNSLKTGELETLEEFMGDLLPPPSRHHFRDRVFTELRKTKRGQLISYQQLAINSGNPKAARAVGRIIGKNQLPLLIPCHRVVAKSHPGGFSAPGGLATKTKLLELEGVFLEQR